MRIANEATFLANMSNGQKHMIEKLQQTNDEQAGTIKHLQDSKSGHYAQEHTIEHLSIYLQLLTLLGATTSQEACVQVRSLQRKARAFDSMQSVAAQVFK